MANYPLTQSGAEVQALLNKVQTPDTTPTAGSQNLITSGGVKAALDQKAAKSDVDAIEGKIPASASSSNKMTTQADIADFITRAVNDLVNYYTKSETYSQTEVNNLIGALHQFHFEIYATLPATGDGSVLYLIGPTGTGSDKYEEYVWANNTWTKIGDTTIDLSGYVTTEALNTALADYTTTEALAELLANKANMSDLEDGTVVPKLAGNLESWASRDEQNVESQMTGYAQTTGGDESINAESGATLLSIAATGDFSAQKLIISGFNQLRLQSNNGPALAIGTGFYFAVPMLVATNASIGTGNENNGILFTGRNHENLRPTVYFKPFSSGVPTSVTDGTPATYTDKGGRRHYTTPGPGWLIVSGITWADTCAHVGWSKEYDTFVSPTDANDAGTIIDLTPLGTMRTVGNGVSMVQDRADRISDTQMALKTNVALVTTQSLSWANTADEVGEGAVQTYTHSATISAMLSGSVADILLNGASAYQSLLVDGQTVSFSDTNATVASGGSVKYALASPTSANKNVPTKITKLHDWGIDSLVGASGSAIITSQYAQGIPDALVQLLAKIDNATVPVISEALSYLYYEIRGMRAYLASMGDFNARTVDVKENIYRMGQKVFDLSNGAPQEPTKTVGLFRYDTTNNALYVSYKVSLDYTGWRMV